jgi:hypothetical protein
VLTAEQGAACVAFRKLTLLSLDDCLYALQSNILSLTRLSLHRCFQRHGITAFPHLTFQEYLAAYHIASLPDSGCINQVMEHLHEAWWREMQLMTIGQLSASPQGTGRAAALLNAILHVYQPPHPAVRFAVHQLLRRIGLERLMQRQAMRHVAWMMAREPVFVLRGLQECDPARIPGAATVTLAAWIRALPTVSFIRPDGVAAILAGDLYGYEQMLTVAVVQALLEALRHPVSYVQWAAARSLGKVGVGEPGVVQALLAVLRDKDWEVRQAAADAIQSHQPILSRIALGLSNVFASL